MFNAHSPAYLNRGRFTLGDISSFKSATIKYGVLWQEGKNGQFYEAKVALDFDLQFGYKSN